MASSPQFEVEHDQPRPFSLVHALERGDGFAHVLVAFLLLLLAVGILITSTYGFIEGWIHNPAPAEF
ncbi:hypothetical protein, partial [Klebsiella pneumoniae]|uniref:hypothetical protein n=1 Tax=Klebsiella pneumoniae TaxID=573 RepID=UPI003CEB1802